MKIPIERALIVLGRNYIQAVTFSVLRRKSWRVHNVFYFPFFSSFLLESRDNKKKNIYMYCIKISIYTHLVHLLKIYHTVQVRFPHIQVECLTCPQGGSQALTAPIKLSLNCRLSAVCRITVPSLSQSPVCASFSLQLMLPACCC